MGRKSEAVQGHGGGEHTLKGGKTGDAGESKLRGVLRENPVV